MMTNILTGSHQHHISHYRKDIFHLLLWASFLCKLPEDHSADEYLLLSSISSTFYSAYHYLIALCYIKNICFANITCQQTLRGDVLGFDIYHFLHDKNFHGTVSCMRRGPITYIFHDGLMSYDPIRIMF